MTITVAEMNSMSPEFGKLAQFVQENAGGGVSRGYGKQWSVCTASIAIDDDADTLALGNIVVADIPTGGTVTKALLHCFPSQIENTLVTENKFDGATVANTSNVFQIKKSTGSYIDAINILDHQVIVPASTVIGGVPLVGTIDVKSQVDGNATYNVQLLAGLSHGDDLIFRDVYCLLEYWWSV